ncbi:MAG: RNA-binding protein [Roseiarcus sp.]|uniref:RNA-binding protein n=1 Tax=Roseiarcus sp. TaxID=1969460 RepID=UPI003BB04FD5
MRINSSAGESGSERTCIVTGVKDDPAAMLRFALAGDGSVVPDIRRNLPGRGVWTRLSFEAVRRAAAKGAFARAFRAKAEAPLSLAETVDALLERDALQSLSIANKAGLAVSGAFKVDAAITAGGVAALIQASDGAADGASKREQALRVKLGPAAGTIARINVFSSSQLGLALGKANVIHAALKSGAASSAFLARAERLRRYRASEADAATRTQSGGAPADSAATLGRPDELADRPSD